MNVWLQECISLMWNSRRFRGKAYHGRLDEIRSFCNIKFAELRDATVKSIAFKAEKRYCELCNWLYENLDYDSKQLRSRLHRWANDAPVSLGWALHMVDWLCCNITSLQLVWAELYIWSTDCVTTPLRNGEGGHSLDISCSAKWP